MGQLIVEIRFTNIKQSILKPLELIAGHQIDIRSGVAVCASAPYRKQQVGGVRLRYFFTLKLKGQHSSRSSSSSSENGESKQAS